MKQFKEIFFKKRVFLKSCRITWKQFWRPNQIKYDNFPKNRLSRSLKSANNFELLVKKTKVYPKSLLDSKKAADFTTVSKTFYRILSNLPQIPLKSINFFQLKTKFSAESSTGQEKKAVLTTVSKSFYRIPNFFPQIPLVSVHFPEEKIM